MIKRTRTKNVTFPKLVALATVATLLTSIFSACSFQKYTPAPIDTIAVKDKFDNKDPASDSFQQYLLNNGYTKDQLPLQEWNLEDLNYCALFFHPSLELARAQLRAGSCRPGSQLRQLSFQPHVAGARGWRAGPVPWSDACLGPVRRADFRHAGL